MLHRIVHSNVRAIAVLAIVSIATFGGLAYHWIAPALADPRPSVLGVRLGMTADEIRRRVDETGPGEWSSRVTNGDWVLTHAAPTSDATFEIHEGQLVAVRVDASGAADLATTPRVEVTPGSILVRERDGDRVRITLLSRSCPTHHDEAERLVARYASAH